MEVKDIIIYPIKSLGGISTGQAKCEQMGFQYDRRMMLVDQEGIFVTQRDFPKLSGIGTEWSEEGFRFYLKGDREDFIEINHACNLTKPMQVRVWNHEFQADQVRGFDDWFSNIIGSKVHLVKMTEKSVRHKSLKKSPSRTLLSMADGYPYLIISEASLSDLNQRLNEPVLMNRFRPNLVLGNTSPYQEEEMDYLGIGAAKLRMIKPCARCIMVNIDQKTSKKLVEPLKTLSLYKKQGNKIYFGMNAVCVQEGIIRKGDLVS
ncbi:MOSC domain-containing protein [Portibacter marinus]|uniref:MOSC domain-containing protein n=1 Tax=Portibacter marinus TaxID=2898660 RepID=UPI001F228FDC|nr:MOSC N-terminal beta barrel domain-containing protein [Portibacter marinus]